MCDDYVRCSGRTHCKRGQTTKRFCVPFCILGDVRPIRVIPDLLQGESSVSEKSASNRELGLRINREVWNDGQLAKIEEYFTEDFVADRTPYGIIRGHEELRAGVVRSRAAFEGF